MELGLGSIGAIGDQEEKSFPTMCVRAKFVSRKLLTLFGGFFSNDRRKQRQRSFAAPFFLERRRMGEEEDEARWKVSPHPPPPASERENGMRARALRSPSRVTLPFHFVTC